MEVSHDRLAGLSRQQRARLYELLQQRQRQPAVSPIKARCGAGDLLPLSFGQERLWFLDQLEPASPFYTIPGALRLQGDLDCAALHRSLAAVVERHEVLRTRFVSDHGQPRQRIQPAGGIALPVCDLSALTSADREAEVERLVQQEASQPFDLASGPVLRLHLVRAEVRVHVLLVTMHHIVSDGWSLGVYVREVSVCYRAFREGRDPQLPPLPVQYVDFALWQREWKQRGEGQSQLEYWQRQLRDLPLLVLPTDAPRPAVQRYRGASLFWRLPRALHMQLNELSQRAGVTLFMTLLASFQVVLARYSGQEDIAIGTPIANRTRREIEGLIGFFVNTLVMRTSLAGQPDFNEVLRRVKEVALGAYANQDLPFDLLVEVLQPERVPGRNPLFQVLFQVNNTPVLPLSLPGVQMTLLGARTTTAKFDLAVDLVEREGGLCGTIEYNTDLFAARTIERLLEHWQRILQGAVAQPDLPVARLPLLTPAEHEQILALWAAAPAAAAETRCLHVLFEEQVRRTPDAVALVFAERQVTYEQLHARSNQLARVLRSRGVGPESLVGVHLEQASDVILAVLAILKAGGAYVPVDPHVPQERLAFLIHDAQIGVLLTRQELLSRPAMPAALAICLDTVWETMLAQSTESLAETRPGSALAYVIYTSGSTGIPRGVAVTHQAVTRLVLQTNYVWLGASDRVAQASNPAFDAATFEIWGALLHGAQLVSISREVLLSPPALAAFLQEAQITTLFLTTALLNQVVQEVPAAFHPLRTLLFGGEAVTPKWVARALAHGRPQRLLHVYGPTENTTFSSWYLVTQVPPGASTLPIGFPVTATQGYVLDRQMQPVPTGLPGELYLGGDGLARGYLGRADVTAARFVPHPYSSEPGARLYRTGDQVLCRADGALEFVGRLDQQVKIRGFRIEPGEIEAVLARHPAVQEQAVLAHEEGPGVKRLVAYIVAAAGQQVSADALRRFVQDKLPEYMVPAAFVFLEVLPLTPNGKLDRRRLPVPDFSLCQQDAPFVAPRDAVEVQLALVWEEVLQVSAIGITANFFDLGGHSLLAVQLMAGIEQRFGQRLPLALLFQEATIERLAVVLRQQAAPRAASPLVALQTAGTQPPLFLVHAGGGSVFCYVTLARYLGQDQPTYGLQAPGLYEDGEPWTDLRELAARYVRDIRTVQPDGPYALGGWCGGGLIAYEMAQQLQQAGQQVRLLLLLDSAPPCAGQAPGRDDALSLLTGFAGDLLRLLGERTPMAYLRALLALLVEVLSACGQQATDDPRVTLLLAYLLAGSQGPEMMKLYATLTQQTPQQRWRDLLARTEQEPLAARDTDLAHLRRLYHVYCSNARAIYRYVPRVYTGRIALCCASEKDAQTQQAEAAAWQQWASAPISLFGAAGDHYTMLKEPDVRTLAGQIQEQLQQARLADGALWLVQPGRDEREAVGILPGAPGDQVGGCAPERMVSMRSKGGREGAGWMQPACGRVADA